MNEALELLREASPDAFELGRLASLAARVEPELLRALRLELGPSWDASAEADLWWSGIVETRSPTAIRLCGWALADLRAEVRGRLSDARRAHEVIRQIHAGEPDLLQLEETLVYQALVLEDRAAVEGSLRRILGTLLDGSGRAAEVASWAVGALPRLPVSVRELPLFWSVIFAAGAQGRGTARLQETPPASVLTGARDLLPAVPWRAGLVAIEVAWQEGRLLLRRGEDAREDSGGIVVPNVDPVVLEIFSGGESTAVAVERFSWKPVKVRGGAIGVRAVDGRTYELRPVSPAEPEQGGDERATPPWIGVLGPFPWRLWPTGSTLEIAFLDGSDRMRDRAVALIHEWSEHVNLDMRMVAGDALVRITFEGPGAWSYHGTDCEKAGPKEPTVNFGGLTEDSPEEQWREIVLHEMGHVLGLVNEAQSPNARIPWNADAVHAEYGGSPNHWSREEVERNMLGTYAPAGPLEYREFDPESIMLHEIPARLTTNGFSTEQRSRLSESDREFVRRLYPRPVSVGQLFAAPEGEPREFGMQEIRELELREVHEWEVVIERAGEYDFVVMGRESGLAQTVVTLTDAAGHWHVQAHSNEGTARIRERLERGTWVLRISASDPLGSGRYEVRCLEQWSRYEEAPEGHAKELRDLLSSNLLKTVHEAAVASRLPRAALLSGIPAAFAAGLPSRATLSDQLLSDLFEMNRVGSLADGTAPLAIWLKNAIALTGPRKEASVFKNAIALFEKPLSSPPRAAEQKAGPETTQRPRGKSKSKGDSPPRPAKVQKARRAPPKKPQKK